MSLNAATIEILLAKGLTGADLLDVARAMEKRADPTAAERQRKCRANKKAGDVSHRDVTRDPPIDNNHTPSNSPSEAKASLAPKGKATRLPADWQPEPLSGETAAMVSAWPVGMLERELSKFRDYWAAASGRKAAKLDWNAAFRNWLRNANEWASRNGTANRSNHQNGAPRDGFTAVLRDVGSRENTFSPAGDDGGMRTTSPVGLIASC
jgi:hypothetical protein